MNYFKLYKIKISNKKTYTPYKKIVKDTINLTKLTLNINNNYKWFYCN